MINLMFNLHPKSAILEKYSQSNKYQIMAPQHNSLAPTYANFSAEHQTIPKNQILNWLYSTDRHVSLEKLGSWLEDNTDGQYKIVRKNTGNINKKSA